MRATRDSRVTNKKKTAFAKQFECFSIFQNRFVLQFFIYRKWFICFVVWLRFVPVIFINLKTLIHSIYYLLISVCVCVRVCMVGPCVFVLSVPFKFRHWIIHAENRHLRDTIVTELLVLYFFSGFFFSFRLLFQWIGLWMKALNTIENLKSVLIGIGKLSLSICFEIEFIFFSLAVFVARTNTKKTILKIGAVFWFILSNLFFFYDSYDLIVGAIWTQL